MELVSGPGRRGAVAWLPEPKNSYFFTAKETADYKPWTGKCRMAGNCRAAAPGHRRGSAPAPGRRSHRQVSVLVLGAALTLTAAACSSSGTSGSSTGGQTLTVAMVEAFTGPNSIDGI